MKKPDDAERREIDGPPPFNWGQFLGTLIGAAATSISYLVYRAL
jgi:hypothetical protein